MIIIIIIIIITYSFLFSSFNRGVKRQSSKVQALVLVGGRENEQPGETRHGNCWFKLVLCSPLNNEANALFNDALNTFYLRLYGIRIYGKGPFRLRERKPAATTWASFSN